MHGTHQRSPSFALTNSGNKTNSIDRSGRQICSRKQMSAEIFAPNALQGSTRSQRIATSTLRLSLTTKPNEIEQSVDAKAERD